MEPQTNYLQHSTVSLKNTDKTKQWQWAVGEIATKEKKKKYRITHLNILLMYIKSSQYIFILWIYNFYIATVNVAKKRV